jgi:predicted metal-dependent hydrolase
MRRRRPDLDFSGLPAVWSQDPSCAAELNASGALAPAVEPYLNRVMAEAARRLGPGRQALKADIALLTAQETEHVIVHEAFNAALFAQGFGALAPLVDELKLDLARQYRDRSFAFNLAWCVGFETFTLYLGQFLFGPGSRWLSGGDPRAVALWRWHLAEEYEHRSVCQDAYRALVGDYPLRVWGVAYVHRHIGGYRRRALRVLGEDRPGAFSHAMAADLIPRLLPAALPFHDPAKAAVSAGMAEALAAHAEPV